jgi:hypothetical protein
VVASERVEAFGQLRRAAQRDQVAAIDLVDIEPESLAGDAALKRRREQAIVPPDDDSRRDIRPGGQRPGLAHRGLGLFRFATPICLRRDFRWDVMEIYDRIILG